MVSLLASLVAWNNIMLLCPGMSSSQCSISIVGSALVLTRSDDWELLFVVGLEPIMVLIGGRVVGCLSIVIYPESGAGTHCTKRWG